MATDTRFVRGAEKLSQRIRTIRERTDVVIHSEMILGLIYRRTMERFRREVDPDGVPWASRMQRPSGGIDPRSGKQILVRTGGLRDAIKIIRGAPRNAFAVATGAQGRIGIDKPRIAKYARYQQQGTETITPRRFLGIGALDVRAVDSLLRRAIIRASGME